MRMFMSPKRTSSFCVAKNKLQKFTSSFPSLRLHLSATREGRDNVGTLDSEALQACFHVCVITMKLLFSIREFRSQQISSSTENVYLVKTSVIFTIRRHLEGLKTNFSALHLGGHGSSELLLFKIQ